VFERPDLQADVQPFTPGRCMMLPIVILSRKSNLKIMKAQNSRLYYIDWLRIFAFGLLFLFHSWRPFDHYSWSIKNSDQSAIFDLLTFFTHGWRMDLIFLISGVGTWFAMNSRKSSFFFDRIKRLIIPFIFGIIFIIPPQKFYEAISFYGFHGDYFQFLKAWPVYAFSQKFGASVLFWFGHLGAHIYYLPYLFTMTLIVVPVHKIIQHRKFNFERPENLIVTPRGVFLLLLPMIIIRYGLKPIFPGYTDWADFFLYMCIFTYGFIFVKNHRFVEIIKQRMWLFLNIGMISNVLLFYYINQNDAHMQWYLNPEYGINHLYLSVLSVLISFCWVMFFVGLAARKLNFNHKFIQPANTAILPIYILHQTLIVVFGYYIIQLNTSIFAKYLLIAGTAIPSAIMLYLVVKKNGLLRFLFGLKAEPKKMPECIVGK
jgi:glucans biosynthesis protein C